MAAERGIFSMNYLAMYDFLKAAESPLSLGQIHAVFPDYSRRQISSTLQMLTVSGIAFRSLRQGKAYYSTDPAQGTGANPCQKKLIYSVYLTQQYSEPSEVRRVLKELDAFPGTISK